MDRPFPAYTGDEPYVFVSYSHSDSSAVYPELIWLKESGFNVWYDEGIEAGTEWREEIASAVENAKVILFFVTPVSARSENCRREVNFGLDQQIPIVAVHLEPTDLSGGLKMTLSEIQAILKYEIPKEEYQQKLQSRISSYLDQPITQPVVVKRKKSVPIITGIAGFVVLTIGLFIYNQQETETVPFTRSVTILPFTSVRSTEKLDTYVAGLTEEIMGLVGGYQELQTISASDPDSKTNALANYQVKGSLQERDSGVRIRVQLTRTDSGQSVWSDTFNTKSTATSDEQTRLATKIARFVRLQLVRDHECENIIRTGRSPEAAEYTCTAVADGYQTQQGGVFDPVIQINNAERALELDPSIPDAHFMAITGHLVQVIHTGRELARDSYLQIPRLVENARKNAPDNFLTLMAQAWVKNGIARDYDANVELLNRAVRIDPLHPAIYQAYASLGDTEIQRGNLAKAAIHFQRALRVYDADGRIFVEYARLLRMMGKSEEALQVANSALELVSNGHSGYWAYQTKVMVLLELGNVEEAKSTLDHALTTLDLSWQGSMVYSLAQVGRTDEARRLLEEMRVNEEPRLELMIPAYIAMGEHKQAFNALERGIEERFWYALWGLRVDPIYNPLKSDPRWAALMSKLDQVEAEKTY